MIRRAIILVLAAVVAPAALSQDSPDIASKSARGVAGSVEVSYPPPGLAAKPVRDPDAPMLVRVTPLDDDRFRIEYLGLISGEYDLAPFLEQRDGRPATGLDSLTVRIDTQLPSGHGTDVFGLDAPQVSLVSRYDLIAGAAVALWVATPIVAITLRAMRRKPVVVAPPARPEPTAHELLRNAVREAQGRELTIAERGRLELLLFRALANAEDGSPRSTDDLSREIAALRSDPRTEGVVLALERWLHAERPDGAEAALRTLDAYTLQTPKVNA